jgi:hypothetical protein
MANNELKKAVVSNIRELLKNLNNELSIAKDIRLVLYIDKKGNEKVIIEIKEIINY